MYEENIQKGKNRGITFDMVWDWDNLILADARARKAKGNSYGVRKFDYKWWKNMTEIQQSLIDRTYRCMPPVLEDRVCEHKHRTLAKVWYYYNVVHHAVMNVCEPVIRHTYYFDSYASIKGRGLEQARKRTRKYIDLHEGPIWWVQIDFVKFYHHINRQRLYNKLCKLFTDPDIRWHLHNIIYALGNHNGLEESDGTEGLGIGLYPVQTLANYHLNDLDRELARLPGVRGERYCDNILIMGDSPEAVQNAIDFTKKYAKEDLQQPLHQNIGIQKLCQEHPIDFVGYKFYKDYTYIRNSMKYRFKRKVNKLKNKTPEERQQVLSSYKGWLMHCNGLTLWQKVTGMKKFSDLNIKRENLTKDGQVYYDVPTVNCSFLIGRNIIVKDFQSNVKTRQGDGRYVVLIEEGNRECKFFTNNPCMKNILEQCREQDAFPFEATLMSRNLNNNVTEYYFQ